MPHTCTFPNNVKPTQANTELNNIPFLISSEKTHQSANNGVKDKTTTKICKIKKNPSQEWWTTNWLTTTAMNGKKDTIEMRCKVENCSQERKTTFYSLTQAKHHVKQKDYLGQKTFMPKPYWDTKADNKPYRKSHSTPQSTKTPSIALVNKVKADILPWAGEMTWKQRLLWLSNPIGSEMCF